jgi:hypothetical protein
MPLQSPPWQLCTMQGSMLFGEGSSSWPSVWLCSRGWEAVAGLCLTKSKRVRAAPSTACSPTSSGWWGTPTDSTAVCGDTGTSPGHCCSLSTSFSPCDREASFRDTPFIQRQPEQALSHREPRTLHFVTFHFSSDWSEHKDTSRSLESPGFVVFNGRRR